MIEEVKIKIINQIEWWLKIKENLKTVKVGKKCKNINVIDLRIVKKYNN